MNQTCQKNLLPYLCRQTPDHVAGVDATGCFLCCMRLAAFMHYELWSNPRSQLRKPGRQGAARFAFAQLFVTAYN